MLMAHANDFYQDTFGEHNHFSNEFQLREIVDEIETMDESDALEYINECYELAQLSLGEHDALQFAINLGY